MRNFKVAITNQANDIYRNKNKKKKKEITQLQCTYILYPTLGSQPDDDPMGSKHVPKEIIV
jgi:hypothetical protein